MTVALLGAADVIGRRLAPRLVAAGWELRVLRAPGEPSACAAHDPFDAHVLTDWQPRTIATALGDATHLVWVLGGALVPFATDHGEAAFPAPVLSARVLEQAGQALAEVVRERPLERVLLVSMVRGAGMVTSRRARAHDHAERLLAAAGTPVSIVRASVPFGDLVQAVTGSSSATVRVIGDGRPPVNPVHESDVADLCVRALAGLPTIQSIGGPELVSLETLRRSLGDLSGAAAHAPPAISLRSARLRLRLLRLGGLRWPSPANAEAFEYAVLAARDGSLVAPRLGRRGLAPYLARRRAGAGETREYAVPEHVGHLASRG